MDRPVWAYTPSLLLVSTDGGLDFTVVDLRLPGSIQALVAPFAGQTIFVATTLTDSAGRRHSALARVTAGAAQDVGATGLPRDSIIDTVSLLPGGRILVGPRSLQSDDLGLDCSTDEGQSWQTHCYTALRVAVAAGNCPNPSWSSPERPTSGSGRRRSTIAADPLHQPADRRLEFGHIVLHRCCKDGV